MNSLSTPSESLGEKLKQWRLARNLSQGILAAQAGVHKSTISYWEANKRQPSFTELNAVLSILDVPTSERSLLWQRIDAPRAIHALRRESFSFMITGDLLKAMRERIGMTQEETAAQVGVSRGAIAQWENGDAWPEPERLHRLCYVLRATDDEVTALTMGRFIGISDTSLEALTQEFHNLLYEFPFYVPRDLPFLRLKAAFERLKPDSSVTELLIHVLSRYAQYLYDNHRFREATGMINEASRLMASGQSQGQVFFPIHALIVADTGTSVARQKSIAILHRGLENTSCKTYRAWMMSDIGNYTAQEGNIEMGLRWMGKAYDEACAGGNTGEAVIRRREWASLLLRANRAGDALHLVPPPTSYWEKEGFINLSMDELFWIEALWQTEEKNAAQDLLVRTMSRVERIGQPRILSRAVRVAEKLPLA